MLEVTVKRRKSNKKVMAKVMFKMWSEEWHAPMAIIVKKQIYV
jgi:hypothetical protein